ncbi:hypothetical protein HHK36_002057 [Tetracentron sinense]|uniref:Uncharacterized protein n=1 Tax=Tetracentron sinense TaxID=13715 RepID=A0A835DRM3_TETSI|nr:hypothetical protein HHK36_002057 [Tetracentron sinense]
MMIFSSISLVSLAPHGLTMEIPTSVNCMPHHTAMRTFAVTSASAMASYVMAPTTDIRPPHPPGLIFPLPENDINADLVSVYVMVLLHIDALCNPALTFATDGISLPLVLELAFDVSSMILHFLSQVLRERGIDDVAINNLDPCQPPNRVKHDLPMTETLPESAVQTTRYSERADNLPLGQWIGKDTERKDHRPDPERADVQKRNWQNENWKNGRETGKQHQHQERQPEPETWRKPVEQPKPAPPDAQGLRYGKTSSALQLTQAFSRSISDPKMADCFSGQRGLPDGSQMPFSRLTDTRKFYSGPNPRRQINGY